MKIAVMATLCAAMLAWGPAAPVPEPQRGAVDLVEAAQQ